jgi:hypothetical protein
MGELVTINAAAALVAAGAPDNPIVALPASIASGMKDLMIAFAAPNRDDADTLRLLQIYAKAISQFDVAVAESALSHLQFHNPRNPFRPTPQDVFEACEATRDRWSIALQLYFLGDDDWKSDLGSAPLTPGCIIPDELVTATLKAKLHAVHAMRAFRDDEIIILRNMCRSRIIKIPEQCFAEGQREELMRAIAIREEQERRYAEEHARFKAEEEEWRQRAAALAREVETEAHTG